MTLADDTRESAEALVEKARAAVPVLAAHADSSDERCRVSSESNRALLEADAFALGTPREFGGLGADLVTMVRVLAELGRGCPSSAWVAAVSEDAKHQFSPMMTGEARAEIYTDPNVRMCSVSEPGTAVEVAGGMRITGRWPYASGSEDAHYASMAAAVAADGGSSRLVVVLVPVSELDVERTWRTAGMRGTGSHTLVASEVFVPAARVIEFPVDSRGVPDLSGGRPLVFMAGALLVLAPLVGAARGALDTVKALLSNRKPPLTAYESLAESPSARHLFAEAEHEVSSGHDRLVRLAGRVHELMPSGGASAEQRSAFRMEGVAIVRELLRATDRLLDLHGSSGFSLDSPLQRFWRDLNVGARHVQFSSYLMIENRGLVVTGTGAPILPFF